MGIPLESTWWCDIHSPFSSGLLSTNSWEKYLALHQLIANLFWLLFGAGFIRAFCWKQLPLLESRLMRATRNQYNTAKMCRATHFSVNSQLVWHLQVTIQTLQRDAWLKTPCILHALWLVSEISFFSLPRAHQHRWELEHRLATHSGSSFLPSTTTIWYNEILRNKLTLNCEQNSKILYLFHLGQQLTPNLKGEIHRYSPGITKAYTLHSLAKMAQILFMNITDSLTRNSLGGAHCRSTNTLALLRRIQTQLSLVVINEPNGK